MLEKLLRFLGTLSQVPGLDRVGEIANRLYQARHTALSAKDRVVDAIEDTAEAKEAGSELLGLGDAGADKPVSSDSDDRILIRSPPSDDGERTILRPSPGGRGAGGRLGRTAPRTAPEPVAPVTIRGSGLNPLVDAATELFSLVGQLRDTAGYPDAAGLRANMAQRITEFDTATRSAGVANEVVLTARYALCTLLDEIVLITPWGSESQWSQHSLLSQFHNETWGGEKFFIALERALKEPARRLHLLEFMYMCIALGLEGKYRVLDRGRSQLETIQDNLFRTIRQVRGEFERELSPHWRGVEDRRSRLARYLPLWAVGALTGALLLAVYVGFVYGLAQVSDPVYLELSKIGQDARLLATVAPVKRTLTLRELLAEDIRARLVDVVEQTRGSTVEIYGDGFFATGSAEVNPKVMPILDRIADAMNQFPGPVQVTGHTDNQPLGGAMRVRFPTNWHLSQARAEAVSKILAARLTEPARLRAEGRGDTEPKAPNDTPEHRAQNRRVDVTLLSSGGSSSEARVTTSTAAPAEGLQ